MLENPHIFLVKTGSEYEMSLLQERTLRRYVEYANKYSYSSGVNSYGINPNELKLSETVQNHYNDTFKKDEVIQIGDGYQTTHYAGESTRPYIGNGSSMIINEIMEPGSPIADPQGVASALRWDVTGTLNGTEGTWELVIDMDTETVLHFLFNSK